ncbi:hypothetical protein AB6A40_002785 [Gnathostoma spinigerum]|uniref:G2/mitotic-specific cyclin-B3 n=1 Tax=Gnathostoma spinigerum TaxID=75299 RepID=A0ABD6EF84_9BILA
MMLRSRNTNIEKNPPKKSEIPMLKRHANENNLAKEQSKRKRTGLTDLSNAISNNLLIDSSKKSNVSKDSRLNKELPTLQEAVGGDENLPVSHSSPKVHPTLLEQATVVVQSMDVITLEKSLNEYDYDAEMAADCFAVPEYAFDIFRYYLSREPKFAVDDYIPRQKFITKEMRALLIDWMVEVQENFELNHETLYLAVKLTDLYLSTAADVPRDRLQLIASTAILISSKFDERSPPLIDDFLYICEDSFDREVVINMEQEMLKAVGFDLGSPLSYRYLRRYAKVTKTDMATLTLARYILETSLMFYEYIRISDSLLGAAAFMLALRMKGIEEWNDVLIKYSSYRHEDVEPLMWSLNHMMKMRPQLYPRLRTVYNKYSHEIFFHSAAVPLLKDKFASKAPVGPPEEITLMAKKK